MILFVISGTGHSFIMSTRHVNSLSTLLFVTPMVTMSLKRACWPHIPRWVHPFAAMGSVCTRYTAVRPTSALGLRLHRSSNSHVNNERFLDGIYISRRKCMPSLLEFQFDSFQVHIMVACFAAMQIMETKDVRKLVLLVKEQYICTLPYVYQSLSRWHTHDGMQAHASKRRHVCISCTQT